MFVVNSKCCSDPDVQCSNCAAQAKALFHGLAGGAMTRNSKVAPLTIPTINWSGEQASTTPSTQGGSEIVRNIRPPVEPLALPTM